MVDKIDRPSWDEYFLRIAQDISLRSEDLFVRHGCVLVDRKTNHIIGTGYNALISGADKNLIDITNREARRPYMLHAEENACLNSTKNPNELILGAKAYVTGTSCNPCLQRLINFGIKELIEIDQMGSITESQESVKMREILIRMSGLIVRKISKTNRWLT